MVLFIANCTRVWLCCECVVSVANYFPYHEFSKPGSPPGSPTGSPLACCSPEPLNAWYTWPLWPVSPRLARPKFARSSAGVRQKFGATSSELCTNLDDWTLSHSASVHRPLKSPGVPFWPLDQYLGTFLITELSVILLHICTPATLSPGVPSWLPDHCLGPFLITEI